MLEYSNNPNTPPRFQAFNNRGLAPQINYHYSKFLKTFSLPTTQSNSDTSPPNPERIALKYFGNKLYYSLQFNSRSHLSSKNYCKYLRKFSNSPSYDTKPFANPLEQLCKLGKENPLGTYNSAFNKAISACKNLDTLELGQDGPQVSLQSIKKLKRLRSLIMNINENHVYKNRFVIQRLQSLRRINLSIHRPHPSKQNNGFIENVDVCGLPIFYKQLLELPNLRTLNLQLHDTYSTKYPKIIEELLLDLGQSKVHNFNVQVRLNKSDSINVPVIEKALSNIDFLAFRVVNTNSKFIIFDGSHLVLPGTTYAEEVEHFIPQNKKILDIYYKDVAMLDLGSFINKCVSLKSLGLHFGHIDTPISLPFDLSFLQDFKNLILSFEGLSGGKIFDILSKVANMLKGTRTLEATSLLFIFSKLKEEAIDAIKLFHKVLKLNQLRSYTFQFRDKFKFRRGGRNEDPIEAISRQISELNSLENLKIEAFVQGVNSLVETKAMLISLPKLRKLHFSIKSDLDSDPYPVSFYFPFEELQQLRELRLRLKFPLGKECLLHIIDNIRKLVNLEVLEIMEGTLANLSLPLFCSLLKEISRMPQLKELIINAKINEEECGYRDSLKGGVRESLTYKLREEIERLFYGNKRMKTIHIYHSKCYSLKYMR